MRTFLGRTLLPALARSRGRSAQRGLLALFVGLFCILSAGAAVADQYPCGEHTCAAIREQALSSGSYRAFVRIELNQRSLDLDIAKVRLPGHGEFVVDLGQEFSFDVTQPGIYSLEATPCEEDIIADDCELPFEEFRFQVGPAAPEVVGMGPPGEITFQTDLLGNDYTSLNVQTVFQCRDACEADGQCRAWTFVIAGIKDDEPVCFLKNPVPATAFGNTCCSSGIALPKVAAAPAPVEPPPPAEVAQVEPTFDLPAPAPGRGIDFTGEWDTATAPSSAGSGSQYRLVLTQTREGIVTGRYTLSAGGAQAGIIHGGVVIGNELHAIWVEDQARGRVTFKMAPNSSTFSGWYSSGDRAVDPASADGSWNGQRLAADLPQQPVEQVPEVQQPEFPDAAMEPELEPGRATEMAVLVRSANVRAGPSTKDRVLTTLPGGTGVALLRCVRKWCEIDLPRFDRAYVFEDLIRRGGRPQRARVEAAPAMPGREAAEPEEAAMPEAEELVRNAGGRGVILADVDVYDKPGGKGQVLGFINKDSVVAASQADCQGNWCPISGPDVPGGAGWIWADGFLEFR
ncbi:hypothetical protein VW23_020595 [Devosia insulae DS-56]|uniref:Apple domain-containing protein n=1 Tax=Devosia insulae DS-56 TaxID=1116389 RepID=A0A1E5XPL7_9HYPH|nr:PAN domain-containing protein [Devosia insulae]OEO30550.1 hypothetical protein VW23_020595 [Devosia insulae DS-56]